MSESYPTVTEPKRKGRPPLNRPVDKKAEELAERSILPEPPGKTINFDQMQEYFGLLTPEMWGHATVYLYRTRPRIIRQLKDPEAKNYIDCISQPLTLEYMIDRHGGGRYQVEMTNLDVPHTTSRPQPGRGHMFRCNFEIDEVRYPPKLDYEELDLGHRENMSYVALLKHNGILDSSGKPMKPGQASSNGNGGVAGVNTEVVREILGFVSKMTADQQASLKQRLAPNDEDSLSKSIGTIMVERMRQDDPSKQVSTLQTLVTAVKDIVTSSKPADTATSMYGPFLAMLTEQNKTLMTMMERITTRQGNAPAEGAPRVDDMARFNQMFDMFMKLETLRGGGGGGGRRSPWDVGLDYVREIVPPVMTMINNVLPFRRPVGAAGVPAAAAQGQPPAPVAFDPYRDPAAMRAYSQAQNAAAAAQPPQPGMPAGAQPPQPQPGMPANQPAGAPNDLLGVLRTYSGIVVNALNNGTDGADFADWCTGLLGVGTHSALSQPGEEALTQTMMQVPELALFGAVKLRAFAHGFCNYEEILDARESQAGPPPNGAQTTAA